MTLCVCSSDFAGQLDAQFMRDLERSVEITADRWTGRPLHARATEAVTRLARREL